MKPLQIQNHVIPGGHLKCSIISKVPIPLYRALNLAARNRPFNTVLRRPPCFWGRIDLLGARK